MNAPTPFEILNGLRDLVGHDAKSAALIDSLRSHLDEHGAVISVERRINEAFAKRYDFAMVKSNDEVEIDSFMAFYNDAVARLGYAISLAREIELDETDIDFLALNTGDAGLGKYDPAHLSVTVPTRDLVESVSAENLFVPMIEVWKRMEAIAVERTEPELRKPGIDTHQIKLAIAAANIKIDELVEANKGYSHGVEEAFQAKVSADLAREHERLADWNREGIMDADVEVNPDFLDYPEQLQYNINILRTKQSAGTPEHSQYVLRQTRIEALNQRIQNLTEALFFMEEQEEAEADIAAARQGHNDYDEIYKDDFTVERRERNPAV